MTDPTVLAKGGKLENVWVHVSKGAKDAAPLPTVVEMDQKNCMYTPRMTTAVLGQKIQAKNGDPVLHNVHTYFGASTLFNKGMPNDKAAPIETTAKDEGHREKAAAKAEIAQEVARAREQLRDQVAMLAVAGAEKILRREVDAKAHADLLDGIKKQL